MRHRYALLLIVLLAPLRLSAAPPDDAAPGGPDTPARQLPRAANLILPNPFPDDEFLAPTLVSLSLDNATAKEAWAALAAESKMPSSAVPVRPGQPDPPAVTLRLDQQPYMEAVMRIRSQLTTTDPGNAWALPTSRRQAGVWCLSGPFCFAISSIEHSALLGRGGENTFDSLWASMAVSAEPRIRVLIPPTKAVITEATDEKGNSLLPPPDSIDTFGDFPGAPRLHLAYPKDAGRRIAILKGTVDVTV